MQLVQSSLRSRSFLIQFYAILDQFGREIPWLTPLQSLSYTTNTTYFRDQLLRKLACEEEAVIPYQFVTTGESREFAGGVLHFPRSPERLKDKRHREIMERLAFENYHYVSCFQVRDVFRGQGTGTNLASRAISAILATHPKIWGVVSKPHLVSWYQRLGATVLSPQDNTDKLWVVAWEKN
jgi:GNAT superfamily N-acetyltransferase